MFNSKPKPRHITFRNIYNRLVADSPTFFKKLVKICVALSAVGAALVALQTQYPDNLTFINEKLGGYLLSSGLVGVFISSLTVTDSEKRDVK